MGNTPQTQSGAGQGKRALITGATSQIGEFLIPLLLESGHCVTALSRSPQGEQAQTGVEWVRMDIGREPDFSQFKSAVQAVFHLAPLPLLPPLLRTLAGLSVERIIAFGSTSLITKSASKDPGEAQLAATLRDAELAIETTCGELGISWTVFRPTIIYGGGDKSAISFIARHVRRFYFFPIVAGGAGLRQPVFAGDLAQACIQALGAASAHNRSYNLPGGETLTYREMVARICHHQGRSQRIVSIPLAVFRTLLAGLRLLPSYRHLSSEMADRMNQHLCFDAEDAGREFGYRPRGFLRDAQGALVAPGEGRL